eukprot:3934683-Rhodomonas_salina.1
MEEKRGQGGGMLRATLLASSRDQARLSCKTQRCCQRSDALLRGGLSLPLERSALPPCAGFTFFSLDLKLCDQALRISNLRESETSGT